MVADVETAACETKDRRIVDTHVHLWDPGRFTYPWLQGSETLNRRFVLEDYATATAGLSVEAMVFVQCEAIPDAYDQEAAWIMSLAAQDPRLQGIVAWAPLYKGASVREDLVRLQRHPLLKGVRQIIQFQPDLDFCLSPAFLDGVSLLEEFDLSFDICIDHRHMARIVEFANRLPRVRMVLDHIGKPNIRDGLMEPWAHQIRELAALPNVHCKISGVATEANHSLWTRDELARYIEVAVEAFGFDRIMYGSDWPVSTDAIAYGEWVALLETLLAGVPATEQHRFWHSNAMAFYRLGTNR
ncbi:MAG: amidohydrolase family protein [Proteobacteria bacterium]|nr:amidohydrolase family protein [Pseudomonadota bacterium]